MFVSGMLGLPKPAVRLLFSGFFSTYCWVKGPKVKGLVLMSSLGGL